MLGLWCGVALSITSDERAREDSEGVAVEVEGAARGLLYAGWASGRVVPRGESNGLLGESMDEISHAAPPSLSSTHPWKYAESGGRICC